jgi:ABC-2 type transport system ATP-binding protein
VSVSRDPVAAKRLVGYLPESNPLYRDMVVYEFLTFAARTMGLAKSDLRPAFDRVVNETGIDEVFYKPISELSKGYRQRVGLAGALIADPEVLILDEPTEGLDPNQRSDMRTLLTKLAHDKTVIVSTHVLGEAQQIASRIIVLNKGSIAGMGTVDQLLGAGTSRGYTVEIEGNKPDRALAALPSVERVDVVQTVGGRLRLAVVARVPEQFPRELSNVIATHKLVLWRLEPEQGGLERVFTTLTRTGTTATQNHADRTQNYAGTTQNHADRTQNYADATQAGTTQNHAETDVTQGGADEVIAALAGAEADTDGVSEKSAEAPRDEAPTHLSQGGTQKHHHRRRRHR